VFELIQGTLLEETWEEVADFPNYVVSNYGAVVNKETKQPLKPRPDRNNRLRVLLYNEEGPDDQYIHQLVGVAFIDNFRQGMHLSHVSGNTEDNSVMNLRLRRQRPESMDEIRLANAKRRDLWGKRVRIKETNEIFRNARDAAKYIGGDHSSVYKCLRGEQRKHQGYTFEYYD
jgi:hypothetical protein